MPKDRAIWFTQSVRPFCLGVVISKQEGKLTQIYLGNGGGQCEELDIRNIKKYGAKVYAEHLTAILKEIES